MENLLFIVSRFRLGVGSEEFWDGECFVVMGGVDWISRFSKFVETFCVSYSLYGNPPDSSGFICGGGGFWWQSPSPVAGHQLSSDMKIFSFDPSMSINIWQLM